MNRILAMLCMAALAAPAAAQIYKCRGANGQLTYSDQPCKGGKSEAMKENGSVSTIVVPPAPKATPTPVPVVTPTPAKVPTPEPQVKKVDPDARMVDNCSADNPDRDPEFCRPGNLNNVYGTGGKLRPRQGGLKP
ncbi:DUF4124 domain-containing protein [Chitinibacteraceae bacterium HSL-7]